MNSPLSSPEPQPPEEPRSGPWLGLGIGFVLIVCIIGFLIYSSRTSDTRAIPRPAVMQAGTADPYAANLAISDVNMSAAENMLGGEVTYIEGNVKNIGDKTVTGATVEVTFKNSLGQVVQRQTEQPSLPFSLESPFGRLGRNRLVLDRLEHNITAPLLPS